MSCRAGAGPAVGIDPSREAFWGWAAWEWEVKGSACCYGWQEQSQSLKKQTKKRQKSLWLCEVKDVKMSY